MFKRRVLTGAIMLSVILSCVLLSACAQPNQFDNAVLDGVAYIYWEGVSKEYDQNGNPYPDIVSMSGSGFFIGDKRDVKAQYIVTNYHVVRAFVEVDDVIKEYSEFLQDYLDVEKNAKKLFPLYICYDKDDYEEAYIVDYDIEKDLAVLRIAEPTEKRTWLKLKTPSNDLIGSTVWSIGYPGVSDELADSVTSYGKKDATVTIGSINREILVTGTGTRVYQTDAKIRAGNSGGPLVDSQKNVLGVNTEKAADWYDPNLNYAIAANELIPLLTKNNVPFTVYEPKPFIVEYLPFLLAGAGVLAILTVLIILLSKKRSAAKVPPPVEPEIVKPLDVPRPVSAFVRSMAAQHGGMTVDLTGQPIMIGRDVSACRIVFKEGTPGISSLHCQISFNEQEKVFILTDLKSTYGTFLSGGQKLTPNVPYTLRQRDSFYLGEQDNALFVDLR